MSKTQFDETIWGPAPGEVQTLSKRKTARKKTKKKKNKKGAKFIFIVLFLAVFFFCGYGGYSLATNWLGEGLNISEELLEEPSPETPVVSEEVEKEAILLVGVDRRENEPARSDTIIVASLDKENSSLQLLSIPRDTYTVVEGHGKTKINHAYAYGEEEMLLKAVNELLDLNIAKYVVVDFQGFVNVIDILGGVKVDVEKRMLYEPEGIDLYPGEQVLNGDQALQYVRFRSDGKGDIGRVARQQKFLKLLADQALNLSTVWKIPDLIQEASRSVETNISLTEMITLANTLKNVDASSIEAETLPGWAEYIDKISYWVPDKTAIENLVQ